MITTRGNMRNASPQAHASFVIISTRSVIAEAICDCVNRTAGFAITACETLDDAVAKVQATNIASVVILDWNAPGMGRSAFINLRTSVDTKIAVMIDALDSRLIEYVLAEGASGVLLANRSMKTFLIGLQMLANGEDFLPSEYVTSLWRSASRDRGLELTHREQNILADLHDGLSNKAIAEKYLIALPTAKMHVHSLCKKLGVRSRLHAVARAREIGLLELVLN